MLTYKTLQWNALSLDYSSLEQLSPVLGGPVRLLQDHELQALRGDSGWCRGCLWNKAENVDRSLRDSASAAVLAEPARCVADSEMH